ncbi:helix-turn-helix transcriptional regulator [Xanthomonas melonis]|uniref:helix-turn-helix transcriptional regulator n=1 Tax=Xanthomonas melonis TaxID=56456 RepID=UPI00142D3119|nr:AlpA family phage regulatory protein [Xanthomonas melonis]MCC4601599.1 AlpA family phage regulatory protein [Xanthomonas melonis]
MSEYTDRFFLHPRLLLSARQVDVYDAINLVIYAKFPLINVRRGKDLVAGFLPRDERTAQGIFTESQTDRFLDKFGDEFSSLRYPIGPGQYEPLLERLLSDGEDVLPFFYSDHHLMVARRRRAAAFTQVHRELLEEVRKGDVILQRSDSERIRLIASDAWMTQKTLGAYLERQGVAPWWEIEANLASHARLERILFSDSLNSPSSENLEGYDTQQVPSFVFAEMLLKRSQRPRGYAQPVKGSSEASRVSSATQQPKDANSLRRPNNQNASTSSDEINDSSVGDSSSLRQKNKQPRPQSQGAGCSSTMEEASADITSRGVPSSIESLIGRESPPTIVETMITKKQVGQLLGIHTNTVDNYRKSHDFPEPVKYGEATLRWKRSDILKWQESRDNSAKK